MEIIKYPLWDNVPGTAAYEPWLMHYKPEKAVCDSAFVLVPGSGYSNDPDRPKQEGERVAKYYCEMGLNVFVLRYRVKPDYFPLPILDGRRAIRYLRYHSEKLGINKNKIAAMGWSSGIPRRFIMPMARSLPKSLIRSSSRERKNLLSPGSP